MPDIAFLMKDFPFQRGPLRTMFTGWEYITLLQDIIRRALWVFSDVPLQPGTSIHKEIKPQSKLYAKSMKYEKTTQTISQNSFPIIEGKYCDTKKTEMRPSYSPLECSLTCLSSHSVSVPHRRKHRWGEA